MSGVLWLLWGLGFVVLEAWGLRKADDEWQPLTYYIRRVLNLKSRTSPGWWLAAGLLGWLSYHFLIAS